MTVSAEAASEDASCIKRLKTHMLAATQSEKATFQTISLFQ